MQSVCAYVTGRVSRPLVVDIRKVQGIKRTGQIVEAINTSEPLTSFENTPDAVSTYTATGSKEFTHSLRFALLGFDVSNNYLQFVGKRFVVMFETDGKYYIFGSDAGASFALEADATGHVLTFTAKSRYPLFVLNQIGKNWIETLAIKTAYNCIIPT